MTTKQTEQASTDAVPNKGDVLLYINWDGKKLYGPAAKPIHGKPSEEPI